VYNLRDALEEDAQERRNGHTDAPLKWPEPMRPEAFHGLPGEFVRLVEPHTEADSHGLLLQLLAAAGNAIGRNPGLMADGAFHATNVCPVLVGASSKSRKGTAWSRVREAMARADPEWADRIEGGLSSGEGLVYQVRDEIRERRKPKKGELPGGDGLVEDIADQGVADKRLCVVETEFAQVFKVLQREGNTLAIVLRTLWDFGQGGGLTKRDRTKVTGGHVCVIGHCTIDELQHVVSDVDIADGLINRFCFCCVKRSKLLPDGGNIPRSGLDDYADRLGAAIGEARSLKGALVRSEEAAEMWRAEYPRLTAERPGRLGDATSRAEAQVLRLSLIFAVLDGRTVVDTEHLAAALAVWDYCFASAAYVFGDSTGDDLSDRILAYLRQHAAGATRTQIRELVGGDKSEARIERALSKLDRFGLARKTIEDTGGRPAERWHATTTTTEEPS
jgi:hypothetical protein